MLAFKVILGLCLANFAYGFYISQAKIDSAFEAFKNEYQRNYASPAEEAVRKAAFTKIYNYIEKYNFENAPKKLKINHFADQTKEEKSKMFMTKKHFINARANFTAVAKNAYNRISVPDSIDWTKKGAVTPVKSQGECGSCWDFAAIAALESRSFIQTQYLISFSEQHVLDCGFRDGCNGGSELAAFDWIKSNGGVAKEECYPYISGATGTPIGTCKNVKKGDACYGRTLSDFNVIDTENEDDMKAEVATNGPITIGICVTDDWTYWDPTSGVFNDAGQCNEESYCDNEDDPKWHAVTVVGYGSEGGMDFWLIKNSWGSDNFGDKGYIKMWRNSGIENGQCFLAETPCFPIV